MSDRFKDYNPNHLYLSPSSLNAWLPESHLAYFISDMDGAAQVIVAAEVNDATNGKN